MSTLIQVAFAVAIIAIMTWLFWQCHKKDLETQAKWNKFKNRVREMHDEELVYQWGKIHDMVMAGNAPIYLKVLDILEDECKRRGFKD